MSTLILMADRPLGWSSRVAIDQSKTRLVAPGTVRVEWWRRIVTDSRRLSGPTGEKLAKNPCLAVFLCVLVMELNQLFLVNWLRGHVRDHLLNPHHFRQHCTVNTQPGSQAFNGEDRKLTSSRYSRSDRCSTPRSCSLPAHTHTHTHTQERARTHTHTQTHTHRIQCLAQCVRAAVLHPEMTLRNLP